MDKYLFNDTLAKLSEVDPAMPLSVLRTFVWVGLNGGRHQSEMEAELGMSNATSSRCIAWWSDWRSFKNKRRGPGYVETYPDPLDRRFRVVNFTREGRAFWDQLMGTADHDQEKR